MTTTPRHILIVAFAALAAVAWCVSSQAQDRLRPPGQQRQAPTLQVRVLTGEGRSHEWTTEITVHGSTTLTLRWTEEVAGANAGVWELTPRASEDHVVASGVIDQVPSGASDSVFTVTLPDDIATLATPRGTTYVVRVQPMNSIPAPARGKPTMVPVGAKTNAVRVIVAPKEATNLDLKIPATLLVEVVTGADHQTEWMASHTLHAPEELKFRWKTTSEEGASGGRWEVRRLDGAGGVLATGTIQDVPAVGAEAQFDIDFAEFLPPAPQEENMAYLVTAWPTRVSLLPGQKKPTYPAAGPKTNPVFIRYAKNTSPPIVFDPNIGQVPPAKYAIYYEWIKCVTETDGLGDDEPMVGICVADLGLLDSPDLAKNVQAYLFGPYEDDKSLEAGEATIGSSPIFGSSSEPRVISNVDDIVIMVAVAEHDDSSLPEWHDLQEAVSYCLLVYQDMPWTRQDYLDQAMMRFETEFDTHTTGGLADDFDEMFPGQFMRISKADLKAAEKGWHYKYYEFYGHGGHFEVAFSMKRID